MKKLFFLFLILANTIFAQNKVDSLISLLELNSNQDAKTYIKLSQELLKTSIRESIHYSDLGIQYTMSIGDDNNLLELFTINANAKSRLGKYQDALTIYLTALDIAEELDEKLKYAEIKNNIGNIYNYLHLPDRALPYYQEALKIREEFNDTLGISGSLNNIGNVYKNTGKRMLALKYLNRSLMLMKRSNIKDAMVPTLVNIGGILSLEDKLDKAEKYYKRAININVQTGDSIGLSETMLAFAKQLLRHGKYARAKTYAIDAYKITDSNSNNFNRMTAAYILFRVYTNENNYENAFHYESIYSNIRRGIYKKELASITEEIESINKIRENEKKIFDLELKKQKLQTNILIFVLIAGFIGIIIFIYYYRAKMKFSSDIKNKNKELKQAIVKAENANEMKSDFLAQMSHEIRTPINTIYNYTSLLKEEFINKLPGDLEGSFSSIENAASRLLRTINLVLNMSDIESGTYEVIPNKVKVIENIINPIYVEFKNLCEAKRLTIEITNNLNYDPIVEVDEYTVNQIMANLVDNSYKYTNVGGINIILTEEKDNVLIHIKDTGIGISDSYIPKLFNKFSQEDQGYTRKFEGTGLGLSLVKKYCEINNVSISVVSQKEKGTTFTLSFKKLN